MKSYFSYIRVSTVKQGEHGSSLQEQRSAITNFATRQGLHISEWFEERETAAKVGRREFTRMVAALKKGRASGVIFHKIDRSARNLKDWSAVQDLADFGIDVRFTQESINLGSNEGKLTGDFLAVIVSVISVFDGGACALFDGWIGVDRFPTPSSVPSCSQPSRTLRAAKAVARRRAILDRRCARRHWLCAGRDGRMVPIEQKDGTSRYRFPHAV